MFKIILSCFILVSSAFAQDMSRTEDINDAYRSMPDGSSKYVGSCLTHEDYEGVNFKSSITILSTIEPRDLSQNELNRALSKIDSSLLIEISKKLDFSLSDFRDFVDDITIDKIQMSKYMTRSFVRANVGVGGGNGSYLIFSKVGSSYKLMSQTFDGDLEFCHYEVWMKKTTSKI